MTEFAPVADGQPDPGEVVWGWAPGTANVVPARCAWTGARRFHAID